MNSLSKLRLEILAYCKENFNTTPEYPWASAPNYAVLRHSSNQKWYAVILDVDRSKLGLEGAGRVDILNIKCDPLTVGELRLQKGFLPAYHMNKDLWLSVLLDGSAPNDLLYLLLNQSHTLTLKKKSAKR